jgi:HlyD family secretion protein
VIVVLLLALVGGGVWAYFYLNPPVAPDGSLRVSGTAEATEYQVSALISARIAELKVDEGQEVKAGDVLATLDDTALGLAVDQANAAVRAAQAAQEKAEKDDDATKADVKAAKARVDQAKAQVKLAELQRGHATVTAPASGVVDSVLANVGEIASPARPLLTIIDTADLYARGYVPEPRLGEVGVGQQVEITWDSTGSTDTANATVTGKVEHIASQAEFTPNTVQTADQRTKLVYEIRVRIADTSGVVKPGMPVDMKLG